MKPRDYCCCAIPLVNAGVYATISEQFIVAVVVGTLAVATPSIVGAATPSFAPTLLAVFSYVAAAVQILGLFSVAQEKSIAFRRYVTLHTLAFIAVFAIAAAWIIISAINHSTAQSNCETNFFSTGNNSTSTEGRTLCNVFAWVDIGIMGVAWVFFALVQSYFLFVVSSYSTSMQVDREKYEVLNDTTKPLTEEIPMADRGGPWDSRASYELDEGPERRHVRQESNASTIVGVPPQKISDSYNTYAPRPHSGGY